ncbi:DUF3099 domain-containing protein [Corynebacterium pelargi]|uniref:Uncharacterized protein n=1 Tax=Corynebacterium pelargi TaxID=1471400 RepID=A0A410W8F1_9CORY|nr:DUF3099 domain-containing protein [Corynebacterium pelargi]QAU52234.1 hypothetical protein CPELA_04775 [Corynebacterium pelargi]GGG69191.1 hypothetical protein GCM10007338_02350 [Corynebacterium pelargi]
MDGRSQQEHDACDGSVHETQAAEIRVSHARRAVLRLKGHRAELVTDAHQSPEENRLHREKVYAWLQGLRIPFLLASGVTYVWWHSIALSAVLFAISIPLPWIAVVIANGVGERRDSRTPAVYKPAVAREYQAFVLEQHRQERALGQGNTAGSSSNEPPNAQVVDHQEAPEAPEAPGPSASERHGDSPDR